MFFKEVVLSSPKGKTLYDQFFLKKRILTLEKLSAIISLELNLNESEN